MYVQSRALDTALREPANVVSGVAITLGVLTGGLMRYLFLVMYIPQGQGAPIHLWPLVTIDAT